MRGSDNELGKLSRQELTELVTKLESELSQKKKSLAEARSRLVLARKKISTLRETVKFQRKRIVELYENQKLS